MPNRLYSSSTYPNIRGLGLLHTGPSRCPCNQVCPMRSLALLDRMLAGFFYQGGIDLRGGFQTHKRISSAGKDMLIRLTRHGLTARLKCTGLTGEYSDSVSS